MNRTREFNVTVGDGSITGTVTVTANKLGQVDVTADWRFPKDRPHAQEEYEEALRKVCLVLADEGITEWSGPCSTDW